MLLYNSHGSWSHLYSWDTLKDRSAKLMVPRIEVTTTRAVSMQGFSASP